MKTGQLNYIFLFNEAKIIVRHRFLKRLYHTGNKLGFSQNSFE